MLNRDLFSLARRYTLGWRSGYLSSVLSLLSTLGMVLAIALLILVLSVMNGFDREMRENILSLVPQLTIRAWQPLSDWQTAAQQIGTHPEVVGVAPFVELQAMLIKGKRAETALLFGVDPVYELSMGQLSRALPEDQWQAFADDARGLLLGDALAGRLGVQAGDLLRLLVLSTDRRQQAAQFAHLRVVGLVHTGTELDQSLAFLRLKTAAGLLRQEGRIDGFRLQLRDLFQARRTGWELVSALPPQFYARDWTQTHGNLYAAIQMSRDLVGLLLLSIIAIAAFNVVSSLVLVVIDKRSDIAILRTLGASPADINGIFLRQGLLIALVGIGLGSLLGVGASFWVTDAVAMIESLLGMRFLDTDVYPIGYLPADLRIGDILIINLVALLLCFLAAIYPARCAAKLLPAEALRHE